MKSNKLTSMLSGIGGGLLVLEAHIRASGVPGSAVSISPGNVLEGHVLGPHPRPVPSAAGGGLRNLYPNKPSRRFCCSPKSENH